MNPIELTEKLKASHGDNLDSVILYGSAANGEFNKGLSDYNLIIVLKNLAPVELAKSCSLVKKWVKDGNAVPLFFTAEAIHSSSDVFPIEFFDIKERHKVLFGSDPFEKVIIDPVNLRHQCEHELRSKMLTLQQNISLLADDGKGLIKLILASSSSFFAIFRGILRLAGARPSESKKGLVEQLSKLTGVDATFFIELIDVREGTESWKREEALEKIEQYLTSLDAVARYVDRQ